MNATENLKDQQLQQSRESTKLHKKTIQNMAIAALKQIPRDMLIEILIKKKIIQKNWSEKGNKYKLRQDE